MFKFTIRDLVLVILASALGIGWWVEHRRLAETTEKLAVHEAAAQRRAKRKQDEKRLADLKRTLLTSKAVNEYGAPTPTNGPSKLTAKQTLDMMEEIGALEERLAREPEE